MVSPCQHVSPQEPLQHEQVLLVQSPVGSRLLSSGSWCTQDFVCALQDWSLCFPQSSGRPTIKSHWSSRSDSLGIPSPFVRSPGWEASCRVQNLRNSARTSSALLSPSLCITHLVGLGFSFYRDCSPPIVLLRLLLCLWTWGIFLLVASSMLL